MTGWTQRLAENESKLKEHSECVDLWVTRARLLRLDDGPTGDETDYGLDEAEKFILKALDLDPDHPEALEEAAHFYDAVVPDRNRAVMYAERCLQLAAKVVDDMKAIIEDPN